MPFPKTPQPSSSFAKTAPFKSSLPEPTSFHETQTTFNVTPPQTAVVSPRLCKLVGSKLPLLIGINEVKKNNKTKNIYDIYKKVNELKKENKMIFVELKEIRKINEKFKNQNFETNKILKEILETNRELKIQSEILRDRMLGSTTTRKKK